MYVLKRLMEKIENVLRPQWPTVVKIVTTPAAL
jgi:hypothetical protein